MTTTVNVCTFVKCMGINTTFGIGALRAAMVYGSMQIHPMTVNM